MQIRKALGLSIDSSNEEVTRGFKQYLKQNHPDKNSLTDLDRFKNIISTYKEWLEKDLKELSSFE